MDPRFERVYTVDDWYDGAREGVADYRGRPHAFRSLYLDSETWDPDEDRFELTPISDEVCAWMVERAALFQRWYAEYQAGRTPRTGDDEPPALAADRARYEELDARIADALARAGPSLVVRGAFEYGAEHGPARARVRWTPLHGLGVSGRAAQG